MFRIHRKKRRPHHLLTPVKPTITTALRAPCARRRKTNCWCAVFLRCCLTMPCVSQINSSPSFYCSSSANNPTRRIRRNPSLSALLPPKKNWYALKAQPTFLYMIKTQTKRLKNWRVSLRKTCSFKQYHAAWRPPEKIACTFGKRNAGCF